MGRRLASLPSHVQITRLRSIIKIFDKHVLIYKTALYSLTSSELVTETKYEGCEILSLRSATHTLLRFRLIRSVFTAIWMSLKRRRPDSCPTCMSSPQTFETIRFLTSGLRQFSVCVDQINLCRQMCRQMAETDVAQLPYASCATSVSAICLRTTSVLPTPRSSRAMRCLSCASLCLNSVSCFLYP